MIITPLFIILLMLLIIAIGYELVACFINLIFVLKYDYIGVGALILIFLVVIIYDILGTTLFAELLKKLISMM